METVVAVSGGVDSVVLLHQLVEAGEYELVVAHFDHGIRESSADDARFVEGLAAKYRLPYEGRREELGAGASEDQARARRYEFLFEMAEKYQAKLATAHHMDDVVETITLNVSRGTRWRGLAGMSDGRIWRPLTKRTKGELIAYALGERLEWVEDETNQQSVYKRNQIRKSLGLLPYDKKLELYNLWQRQITLRKEISREIESADFPIIKRYFMTMLDQQVAEELLYGFFMSKYGVSLLGSQLYQAWMAIKTGRPNTSWQIGQKITVRLKKTEWYAEIAKR